MISQLKTLLFFLAILTLIASNTPLFAETGLRFAADNPKSDAIPPYSWYNQCKQQHQGFNNQLFRKIAADLSLEPEFVKSKLAKNALSMLNQSATLLINNKADFALAPKNFIDQLDSITIGTEPVLSSSPIIMLAPNQEDILDIKELENMTGVGVNIEGTLKVLELQNITTKMTKVASMKQAIMHLVTEKEDYWITDKFMAQYLINELDLHNKVKFSALEVGTSAGIYLITNKQPNNIERLKKMDQLVASH